MGEVHRVHRDGDHQNRDGLRAHRGGDHPDQDANLDQGACRQDQDVILGRAGNRGHSGEPSQERCAVRAAAESADQTGTLVPVVAESVDQMGRGEAFPADIPPAGVLEVLPVAMSEVD